MVKVMRVAGCTSPLVTAMAAAALTVALAGNGGTHQAAFAGLANAHPAGGTVEARELPLYATCATPSRPIRLDDVQPDSRRRDELRLRKREWHRHWDNRLDFWDPSHGRKVFVS